MEVIGGRGRAGVFFTGCEDYFLSKTQTSWYEMPVLLHILQQLLGFWGISFEGLPQLLPVACGPERGVDARRCNVQGCFAFLDVQHNALHPRQVLHTYCIAAALSNVS